MLHALGGEELDLGFLVLPFPGVFRHNSQALRSIRHVKRALKGLRLHAALLTGIFIESELRSFRLPVQLVGDRGRHYRHQHGHWRLNLDADHLAIAVRRVSAVDLQERGQLVLLLGLLNPAKLRREAVADAHPAEILNVDIVRRHEMTRRGGTFRLQDFRQAQAYADSAADSITGGSTHFGGGWACVHPPPPRTRGRLGYPGPPDT